MNKHITVAFDVYGTLVGDRQDEVMAMYRKFEDMGCTMVVWSSAGEYEVKKICDKLGVAPHKIADKSRSYSGVQPDICFDDDETFIKTIRAFGVKAIKV